MWGLGGGGRASRGDKDYRDIVKGYIYGIKVLLGSRKESGRSSSELAKGIKERSQDIVFMQ